MLQAIGKNKARGFLLGGRHRRPTEDIVTDCVFGVLRYFSPRQAGIALHWLLRDLVATDAEITKLRFWPRENGVEPDVVIECGQPSGDRMRIIIEAKWGSNCLYRDQVDRQWNQFGSNTIIVKYTSLHLFVVADRSKVDDYIIANLENERHQVLMTWQDIASNLIQRDRRFENAELHYWAEDVTAVLGDLGQRPFSGRWQISDINSLFEPYFYADDRQFIWPTHDNAALNAPVFWIP